MKKYISLCLFVAALSGNLLHTSEILQETRKTNIAYYSQAKQFITKEKVLQQVTAEKELDNFWKNGTLDDALFKAIGEYIRSTDELSFVMAIDPKKIDETEAILQRIKKKYDKKKLEKTFSLCTDGIAAAVLMAKKKLESYDPFRNISPTRYTILLCPGKIAVTPVTEEESNTSRNISSMCAAIKFMGGAIQEIKNRAYQLEQADIK